MKVKYFLNILLGAVMLGSPCLWSADSTTGSDEEVLPNLTEVKDQLMRYHDSGEYDKALAKVIHEAKDYIKTTVELNEAKTKPDKLALIMDIDETSLSNYHALRRFGFGGTKGQWQQTWCQGRGRAIFVTRSLYEYARERGIAVFFVTGRPEAYRKITIRNLKAVGYHHWAGLYHKPNNFHSDSAIPYKLATRAKINAMGYHIIVNIGDQLSDLEGGYADRTFKLPNPFYFVS